MTEHPEPPHLEKDPPGVPKSSPPVAPWGWILFIVLVIAMIWYLL